MRKLLAFILTVVIYLLLALLYTTQFRSLKFPSPPAQEEQVIKINIRDIPAPQSPIQPQVTPASQPPEQPKKKEKVKPKKSPPKPKSTPKKEATPKPKSQTNKPVPAQSKKKQSTKQPATIDPSEMLYIPNPILQQTPTPVQPAIPKTPKIAKLYGKKFDSFTPNQQKFIIKNLNEIQRITQNTLTRRGYPSGALAARTGQEGTNIVSFDLHPNGNISNLQLLRKVGYHALDDNTIETIKSAYKDYPYPTETTKIIFYVEYSIFGY